MSNVSSCNTMLTQFWTLRTQPKIGFIMNISWLNPNINFSTLRPQRTRPNLLPKNLSTISTIFLSTTMFVVYPFIWACQRLGLLCTFYGWTRISTLFEVNPNLSKLLFDPEATTDPTRPSPKKPLHHYNYFLFMYLYVCTLPVYLSLPIF